LQQDESSESEEFKQVFVRTLDFLTEMDFDLAKIAKLKTALDNCLKGRIKDV